MFVLEGEIYRGKQRSLMRR